LVKISQSYGFMVHCVVLLQLCGRLIRITSNVGMSCDRSVYSALRNQRGYKIVPKKTGKENVLNNK